MSQDLAVAGGLSAAALRVNGTDVVTTINRSGSLTCAKTEFSNGELVKPQSVKP